MRLDGRRVERPEVLAGGGVQGDHPSAGRGGIEHAIDDQVVGLVERAVAGDERPGDLEGADVLGGDLVQRGVLITRWVAEVVGPVGAGALGRLRRATGGQEEDGKVGVDRMHGRENG